MIRIAAVGDIHVGADSGQALEGCFDGLGDDADVFLLAGDLTRRGRPEEAAVLAKELVRVEVPVVAVLGNHDYHSDEEKAVTETLEDAGVTVLEGDGVVIDVGGVRLGVAGTKGFGGGFAGACASDFGEPEMKSFVVHSQKLADDLARSLTGLDADVRVALVHYSPSEETLRGERLEIYPFLGSYLLAEAIDGAGADLALHGHAHAGTEKGTTPGGTPVRNVAQPVINAPYGIYCLGGDC
jgi:Icc-related predicted phosphoesterase